MALIMLNIFSSGHSSSQPTHKPMEYLRYYLIFAAVLVLGVIGLEIRRVLKKRRQEAEDALAEEMRALQEAEEAAKPAPVQRTGFHSMTWHHIAPEIRKGHLLRVAGHTDPATTYEVIVAPQADLGMALISYRHGQVEESSPAGEENLISLHPGMYAILKQEESGRTHLVSGASIGFKKDEFARDPEALVVIENYAPKRQVSELRTHYKFQEPCLTFVAMAAQH